MENHHPAAPAKSKKPRPTIDFNKLSPEALVRAGDFLRPGPVPFGPTAWYELVAAGKAPPPAVRRPRFTVWRWRDVQAFLEALGT